MANLLMLFVLLSCSTQMVVGFINFKEECVPISIPQCKKLGYNMTSSSDSNALVDNMSLGKELIKLVDQASCSKYAMFFLCSVYSPLCMKGIVTEPIKPCQSVCHVVRGRCEKLLNMYGYGWPKELKCEHLPEHNTGICMKPSAFLTGKNAKKSRRKKIKENQVPCAPCSPQKTTRFRNYRKADYVIQASVISRVTTANGRTKLYINVTKIFKQGKVKPRLGKMKIWAPNKCLCPKFEYDVNYIMMGNEQVSGKKERLLYDSYTRLMPNTKQESKRVTRWQEKCQKRKNCLKKRKSKNRKG